jgi:hypothetical protein
VPQGELSVEGGGIAVRVEKFGVAAVLLTLRSSVSAPT